MRKGRKEGVIVEHLSELRPLELVDVDSDRLVELCVRMGENRAEEVIALSVDNLWRGLDGLKACYQEQRFEDLADQSRGLAQIAENLGLSLFVKICRDVEACAVRADTPALSGCLSRLSRIADQSICSVWDLCDIHG